MGSVLRVETEDGAAPGFVVVARLHSDTKANGNLLLMDRFVTQRVQ